VFVFLLTGIMIFSQVLFIIYAMFLPVSFLLSMIPTFDGMAKRAIMKLFNTIMTRAGITLIITAAFSISTMLYTLSTGYPFFLIAFLQIVTFAGIYFKLGDLMSMFSLQSGDSQGMGRQIMRKPRMLMHAQMHRLQRKLGRSIATNGNRSAASKKPNGTSGASASRAAQTDHSRPDGQAAATADEPTLGKRAGQAAGAVMDTKDRIRDTAGQLTEQVKDLPVNAKYAVHHGKSQVSESVRNFTSSVTETRTARAEGRTNKAEKRRQTIAERRSEMEQASQKKANSPKEPKNTAAPVHERPATNVPQEKPTQPVNHSQTQAIRPDTAASTNAGKETARPAVSTVKEHAEQQSPVMEQQAVKADSPSERMERQAVSVGQPERASHADKQPQKTTSPAPIQKEPQRKSVKERSTTVKREAARQEKTGTANTTAAVKEEGRKQ